MVRSFKDRETRRFFEGRCVAAFHAFANQAARRLTPAGQRGDARRPCRAALASALVTSALRGGCTRYRTACRSQCGTRHWPIVSGYVCVTRERSALDCGEAAAANHRRAASGGSATTLAGVTTYGQTPRCIYGARNRGYSPRAWYEASRIGRRDVSSRGGVSRRFTLSPIRPRAD